MRFHKSKQQSLITRLFIFLSTLYNTFLELVTGVSKVEKLLKTQKVYEAIQAMKKDNTRWGKVLSIIENLHIEQPRFYQDQDFTDLLKKSFNVKKSEEKRILNFEEIFRKLRVYKLNLNHLNKEAAIKKESFSKDEEYLIVEMWNSLHLLSNKHLKEYVEGEFWSK